MRNVTTRPHTIHRYSNLFHAVLASRHHRPAWQWHPATPTALPQPHTRRTQRPLWNGTGMSSDMDIHAHPYSWLMLLTSTCTALERASR